MTLGKLNHTSPFHAGTENTAFAPCFGGTSYLNMLSTEQVPVGYITFAPGCHNHWHIHRTARDGGQILLVTTGRGWYQKWGEAPRALHPNDVVNTPPNVKHWHGVTVNSAFRHLAAEAPGEGSQNEWCKPVDAATYRALKTLTGGTGDQQEVFYGTKDSDEPGWTEELCPQIRPTQ